MLSDDLKLKLSCLLRRAGLAKVPQPVLACGGVACVLLLGLALWRFWPAGGAELPAQDADFQVLSQAVQEDAGSGTIVVDVEGAVREPGLYELPAGARVGDAVEAAGGLSAKALAGGINLAQSLEDGQQVVVPAKSSQQASAAGTGAASSSGGLVNINTASAQELQQLSGIGESLSQRIVDYRNANGAFASVDELTQVSGIGEATLEKIRDKVCV